MNILWDKHLDHWLEYLKKHANLLNQKLIAASDDKIKTDIDGEIKKYNRQIEAVEFAKISAVANPKIISSIINPDLLMSNGVDYDFKSILSLNFSQKKAVGAALSDNFLTLIQGPPGTGKTQVISEICLQLFKKDRNVRVLLCSETHIAVNNIINRIAKYINENNTFTILRIGEKKSEDSIEEYSPESIKSEYINLISKEINNDSIMNIINNDIDSNIKQFENQLVLSANFVGMTCNKVGAFQFIENEDFFDYVIIDEVCKATLPDILRPLIVSKKAILVGDPQQLPPFFCDEDTNIIKAIDDCHLDEIMYINNLFNYSNTILLDTQYRMEKKICNLISDLFYAGRLTDGRNREIRNSLVWIDYTPTRPCPNEYDKILINMDEKSIIFDLLKKIDNLNKKGISIAIIAPYRDQVSILRKSLKTINLSNLNETDIEINTVDGVQGKEFDIVIFGITRTDGSFRFIRDERRLNVALSRAKDRLFIVGYGGSKYLKSCEVLKNIFDRCLHVTNKNLGDVVIE